MKRSLVWLLSLVTCFVLQSPGMAEVLYLKNGRKIKGPVTEKTDEYITLTVDGTPMRYPLDEVDTIVKDTPVVQPEPTPVMPSSPEWFVYEDQEYGFQVLLPYDWVERPRENTQPGIFLEVNRSKTSQEEVPAISMIVTDFINQADGVQETPAALAERLRGALEERSRGAQWTFSGLPQEVEMGSEVGVRMAVDYEVLPLGTGRESLRNIKLVCYAVALKDKKRMLCFNFFAHNDKRLKKELGEMEPLIQSLILREEAPGVGPQHSTKGVL